MTDLERAKEFHSTLKASAREELTIYQTIRELNGYPSGYIETHRKRSERLARAIEHSAIILSLLS
jgi:hypothetical protein